MKSQFITNIHRCVAHCARVLHNGMQWVVLAGKTHDHIKGFTASRDKIIQNAFEIFANGGKSTLEMPAYTSQHGEVDAIIDFELGLHISDEFANPIFRTYAVKERRHKNNKNKGNKGNQESISNATTQPTVDCCDDDCNETMREHSGHILSTSSMHEAFHSPTCKPILGMRS